MIILRDKQGRFIKGVPYHTNETKKKISQSHLGKIQCPHSKEHKMKISISLRGKNRNENNPMWKGDNVGYMGLHNWVRRHLGTPSLCEHCGKNFFGKKIQWANKSREYKRDLSDWIRLCVSCHKKYDYKLILGTSNN